MSLSIGILGLPNVGKSTLFQALTRKPVDISNYPFCTIEPNVGVAEVEDERLKNLAEIQRPKRILPALIKFVDVAGLVRGAAQGQGLGNQFLAHLRECEGLLHIVRCFRDKNISHIDGEVNPERDIETVKNELLFKDLETVKNRLQKLAKDVKQGMKEAMLESEKLNLCQKTFEQCLTAKHLLKAPPAASLSHLFLLTNKPMLYVLNCKPEEAPEDLLRRFEQNSINWLEFDLKEELNKTEFSESERKELEFGEPKLSALIKKCYDMLDLVTFFTIVGEEETRAWPTREGTFILEAAGIIHQDFKEKFIRAEVLNCDEVVKAGSWKKARELGLLKTVGKEYMLKDGDVVEIKI